MLATASIGVVPPANPTFNVITSAQQLQAELHLSNCLIFFCNILQVNAFLGGVNSTTNATGILAASSTTLKPRASARLIA